MFTECTDLGSERKLWKHTATMMTFTVFSHERQVRKTGTTHTSKHHRSIDFEAQHTNMHTHKVQRLSSQTTDYVGGYHLLSLSPWGLNLIVDTTHSWELRTHIHIERAHTQGCRKKQLSPQWMELLLWRYIGQWFPVLLVFYPISWINHILMTLNV